MRRAGAPGWGGRDRGLPGPLWPGLTRAAPQGQGQGAVGYPVPTGDREVRVRGEAQAPEIRRECRLPRPRGCWPPRGLHTLSPHGDRGVLRLRPSVLHARSPSRPLRGARRSSPASASPVAWTPSPGWWPEVPPALGSCLQARVPDTGPPRPRGPAPGRQRVARTPPRSGLGSSGGLCADAAPQRTWALADPGSTCVLQGAGLAIACPPSTSPWGWAPGVGFPRHSRVHPRTAHTGPPGAGRGSATHQPRNRLGLSRS